MQANIEQTILRNLLTDEKYMRKVLPFIKPDYFQGVYKTLFKEAGKYVAKYNKLPSSETMAIQLGDAQMSEEQFGMAMDVVPHLFSKEKIDILLMINLHKLLML